MPNKPSTDILPGTLDMLILKAVSLKPLHGYGVLQRIHQISGQALDVPQGSLYPALYRLEHQDLIASEWGVIGWPNAGAYSASKAGLIALTKSLGRELAPEGITVNGIAPGIIDTPQLQVDADDAGITLAEMHEQYARDIPLGHIGRPEDIAAAVSLLARADMGAFVGQTIQINGGTTRCRT